MRAVQPYGRCLRCHWYLLLLKDAFLFFSFLSIDSLIAPRSGHTATMVNNKNVLICGGENSGVGYLATCELYVTTSGVFSATGISCCLRLFLFFCFVFIGTLKTARSGHTATVLNSSNVLICGGENSGGYVASCELYNTTAGVFSAAGIS
jgi:hypothetical protein